MFWVGLSAVAFDEDEERLPLSPFTRSGALIAEVEKSHRTRISFYKTNLVKCLPLKEDKIRYPLSHEMEKCFPNLRAEVTELRPKVIFLLGKQVAGFVLEKLGLNEFRLDENFKYRGFIYDDVLYVPIHHPSFILVYKRKKVQDYIAALQQVFVKAKSAKSVKKLSKLEKTRNLVNN